MNLVVRFIAWIAARAGHTLFICAFCGRLDIDPTDYCPRCGL